MPVVLLVRHGQASVDRDDYDELSDLGREQSRIVGTELRRRGLRDPLIVSGGLRRQRDTATEALGEPEIDDRWDEYDHLRLLSTYSGDGLRVPDGGGGPGNLQSLVDAALAAWIEDEEPDGWLAFRQRAHGGLDHLAGTLRSGQDAVVFTSGGVIAALVARLLHAGDQSVVALNRVCVNGGITKLAVGSSGTSLIAFNDHAHFEADNRRLLTYR